MLEPDKPGGGGGGPRSATKETGSKPKGAAGDGKQSGKGGKK